MRFPVVTMTLADVLPVAIVVAVQSIHYKGVCPDLCFQDFASKWGEGVPGKNETVTFVVGAEQVPSSIGPRNPTFRKPRKVGHPAVTKDDERNR